MRTLKEILETFHDSALAKLTEEEINLESLTDRAKKTESGTADSDKLKESIKMKEMNVERIGSVVKIIERRLEEQSDKVSLKKGGMKPSPNSFPKSKPVIGLKG